MFGDSHFKKNQLDELFIFSMK